MLHLYDASIVIRKKMQKDPFGRAPRSIVTSMFAPEGIHVWVFDGPGSLLKRRELYEGYKVNRDPHPTGFFALVDLIKTALCHTAAFQVTVPGYEADDIIAKLTLDNYGRTPIRIHSSDRDMNQLLRLPGVEGTMNIQEFVDPTYIRLYKTFQGDASDKIPGLRGFGDETWKKCNKEKLQSNFLSQEPVWGKYVEAGMPEKLAERAIRDHEILQKFWTIVGFMEVKGNINPYIQQGLSDPHKADAILKEFYH